MSALYEMHVRDEPKGEVFKVSGRWRWQRGPIATETYHHDTKLADVRRHAARLFRATLQEVTLKRKPWK